MDIFLNIFSYTLALLHSNLLCSPYLWWKVMGKGSPCLRVGSSTYRLIKSSGWNTFCDDNAAAFLMAKNLRTLAYILENAFFRLYNIRTLLKIQNKQSIKSINETMYYAWECFQRFLNNKDFQIGSYVARTLSSVMQSKINPKLRHLHHHNHT